MKCFECGNKTFTTNSRETYTGIVIRFHRCKTCGYGFYTKEEYVDYEDIQYEYNEVLRSLRNNRKGMEARR